jgi:hypothetical protein
MTLIFPENFLEKSQNFVCNFYFGHRYPVAFAKAFTHKPFLLLRLAHIVYPVAHVARAFREGWWQ